MDVTRSRISPSGIGFGVGNSLGTFGLADRVEFESDKLKKQLEKSVITRVISDKKSHRGDSQHDITFLN